jgi:predicted outer membrane protein
MRRFTIRGLTTFASIVGAPLLVIAQQPTATQQSSTQSGQVTQSQPQPGQPLGGQVIQSTQAGGQPASQAGGQSTAHQTSSQQSMQHGQGQDLTSFIVHKLRLGNESEVQLGQLATQQAKNSKVKEFAQQMVQEHQQMIQKLQGVHGGAGAAGNASSQNQSQPGTSANAQRGTTVRPGDPGSAGSLGGAPEQHATGGVSAGANSNDKVPAQLVAMSEQHCRTKAQMTQQMLQKHKGEDFDMAYIGQQILAHTDMLAELQALHSANMPQLQPIVAEAEKATREHLDMATGIAEQLKGSSSSSSERSSSNSQNNERGNSNNNRGNSSSSSGNSSSSSSSGDTNRSNK